MLPLSDSQDIQGDNATVPLTDWATWMTYEAPDDLPSLEFDPFTLEESSANELATLDHLIEEAQAEMNTPDGSRRLDDLLEARDLAAEEASSQAAPEPILADARFLGRSDVDADDNVIGYTVQYMEVYQGQDDTPSGQVLDVGHYDTLDAAGKVYEALQESITDGTLTTDDLPVLAAELAEANGLPSDAWREATPEDLDRYAEQSRDTYETNRDVPPASLLNDTAFTNALFQEVTANPEQAAQEQARLANEQALAALRGIGLTVQNDFNLARDSFYDAERDERLINGIFQQDPANPTSNCRPMLVSLMTAQDGLGFAAQAVEYGQVGSLTAVQADHGYVQAALEEDGIAAGIAAVEAVETNLKVSEAEMPQPEIPTWSREIS